MTLDYNELYRSGRTFLQLPLLMEKRYLLNTDASYINQEGFTFFDDAHMICNTLAIKNGILDYQIWCRVSEEIQQGLYRWVKDVVMQKPRSTEFSKVTELQTKFTSLSKRKWNAKRMRDLEIMDHILTILAHPRVSIMTRKPLFSLTQRLLMEKFRYEEVEVICSFLVNKAYNAHVTRQKQMQLVENRILTTTGAINSSMNNIINKNDVMITTTITKYIIINTCIK